MQIAPMHTVEDMQAFSNVAHTVEALILGAVAAIAFAEALGYVNRGWQRYLWPGLVAFAGLFLMVFMLLPYHGLSQMPAQWDFIFGDPQQQQHMTVALVAVIAGLAEIRARNAFPHGELVLVWPASLIVVGLMFALHKQHGTDSAVRQAQIIHTYLGVLLISTGILRGIQVVRATQRRWLAFSWCITLFAAAAVLGIYREPAGAYDLSHDHPSVSTGAAR
jgi:hypothetical protein